MPSATLSPSPSSSRRTMLDLTTREQEIAEYVCRGFRNRDIALVLGTSVNTVRNQLSAIYARLGVDCRTELALRWRACSPSEPAGFP